MNTKKEFTWDLYTENFVGHHHPEDIKQAIHTYKKDINPSQQYTLIEELVDTRSLELCHAYENVVSIHVGYGFRKNNKGIIKSKGKVPNVIFLVKEKWLEKDEGHVSEKIPKFLFTYCNIGNKRKLCAIPTDVECAKERANVRIDSINPGIEIIPSERSDPGRPGTITCAIQRSLFPDKTYVMSCRHVFSLSAFYHPSQLLLSDVVRRGGDSSFSFAKTTQIKGPLENAQSLSVDSQLSLVTDYRKLQTVLKNTYFTSYAQSFNDIPKNKSYWILTPRGPIEVEYQQRWKPDKPISYGPSDLSHVVHEDVIESVFKRKNLITINGDSGSAVTTEKYGGKLLGMHFYSDDIRITDEVNDNRKSSFCIPAWVLFASKNYSNALPNEIWSILNADELQAELPSLDNSEAITNYISGLTDNRVFNDSVSWKLTPKGISIDNAPPEITSGKPLTVKKVWDNFGDYIQRSAIEFDVPVELIVATICTESGGDSFVIREEPGYITDKQTPHRVSAGLMQTLISTAREALKDTTINREKLLLANLSIRAGTAYISKQRRWTQYDAPKVACAYNAGSIRPNDSAENRWRMMQYPKGKSHHTDRFVKWFNDCFRFFRKENITPEKSFLHNFE